MRNRTLLAAVALSMLAAACGSDAEVQLEPRAYAYGFTPGTSLVYDFTIEMAMDMTLRVEGLPEGNGEMAMTMDMGGVLAIEVDDGPELGTFEVTLSGQIDDVADFSAKIDGRKVSAAERAQLRSDMLASAPIPEITMVIDERGSIVSLSALGEELPAGLLSGEGLGSGFFGLGSGFFGPEFPDGPIGVGDSWVASYHEEVLGMTIDTTTQNEVVDAVHQGDRTLIVIESRSVMEPVFVSLRDMIQSIAQMDPATAALYGMNVADVEAMQYEFRASGIDMLMSIAADPSLTTTWFEVDTGLTHRMETQAAMDMGMSIRHMPEMGNGDIAMRMDFTMEMELRD